METFAQSEKVFELGRKLVDELGLADSTDTLGRWMAHYISDLIVKAENASVANKAVAEKEASEAILNLWRHRSELPDGKRPFGELEPIIRIVESLDPENTTPRYFRGRRPPKDEKAETSEQESWLNVVEGLDYSAKVLIGHCLAEAAGAALDKSKEWVKLAETIDDDGVPEIVIRLVVSAADIDKAPDLNAEQRKLLTNRIERLKAFVGIAKSVAETLEHRLETIPSATESDDETIVLSAPPELHDPFAED
ncbi:hypothetical protein ACVIHI_003133 [Bradyrhizobium sp. USDA 4524]|uniref:AVAST type 3 anti-phage proein Avs3b n=1 Tax=unclassified Bradyrhizobium TaxID=2631580 RepID=UPI00209D8EBD|nr:MULTISPECIES: AVAST type 3 anti-phage proein Avs3b [unclassified Bradyrhizobium]MCP1843948.1 hypothetical protein [Bradyrhizobium sp. USDA 4538]MCP1904514.1 hypothetical protein [Bradyrhizobium sp. USDA 4537]MCP1989830.1 hypothetical protein [Bradyrhizobium sp. USDA 4539]